MPKNNKNRLGLTYTQRERWNKFVRDVGIYGVGNIGAKVITFLMVPFYTYFLPDTAQFGYFDICLTASFLLSTLITLNVRDGLFRFLLDLPHEQKTLSVITAASRLLSCSLGLSMLIMLTVSCFVTIEHHWMVLALIMAVAINDVYGQLVRGLGRNTTFVGMGLATALLVALLSVVMVAGLKMSIEGVFLANILARVLPILWVEARHRLLLKNTDRNVPWIPLARQLMRYCLPLIPTLIIWWVLSFGDRWFVLWAAGPKANGIYAVAARFTGVIYTVAVIMQQAWQETAILQYESDDRDHFFTQIFTVFIYVIVASIIAYTAVLKLTYGWVVGEQYASSLPYIFPMAVGAGIYSIANFFDMGYQCSRQTHRTLAPSVITCLVNVVLNIIMAPAWGAWGVIAASIASFTVYAIYRAIDTRRYFTLRPGKLTLIPIAALAVFTIALYAPTPQWAFVTLSIACIAATVMPAFSRHKKLIKPDKQPQA